ncbi:MAG: phosphonate C-P lyase system protein PhnH [Pseudomonadota bacterium]
MSAAPESVALTGGFENAPVQAAVAFRALLEVMSRPGRIETVRGAAPPAPLPPAAGALALTLCDGETPVWLAPDLRRAEVEDWLRFHCGAPITREPAAAAFAFGPPGALDEAAADFPVGTPEYPDRSATLVALVGGFEGAAVTVTGPGVRETETLALGADAPAVVALCAGNAALFPQGRDLFLVAGERVAGLPRTARLEEG